MQTINAIEFKAKCLQLLDEVQYTGEDLVISKQGRPVARQVAENETKPMDPAHPFTQTKSSAIGLLSITSILENNYSEVRQPNDRACRRNWQRLGSCIRTNSAILATPRQINLSLKIELI